MKCGHKRCTRCKQEKPRTDFYAHPFTADGKQPMCKECCRKSARGNYAANRDRYINYSRKYREQERERLRA